MASNSLSVFLETLKRKNEHLKEIEEKNPELSKGLDAICGIKQGEASDSEPELDFDIDDANEILCNQSMEKMGARAKSTKKCAKKGLKLQNSCLICFSLNGQRIEDRTWSTN